jgi:hypothetical protein
MAMSSWPIWKPTAASRTGGHHGQSVGTQSSRGTTTHHRHRSAPDLLAALFPRLQPHRAGWSKIKQWLRSAKARTAEALERAIAEALAAITADNALAWFSHCGYGLQ